LLKDTVLPREQLHPQRAGTIKTLSGCCLSLGSTVQLDSKSFSCLGRWKCRGSLRVAPSFTVQLPSLTRCAYLIIDSSQLFSSPPTCHSSTINILIQITNLFDFRHPSIKYHFSPCALRTGTSCFFRRFLALPFRSFALNASVLPLVSSTNCICDKC
jgi:hypothetical protein